MLRKYLTVAIVSGVVTSRKGLATALQNLASGLDKGYTVALVRGVTTWLPLRQGDVKPGKTVGIVGLGGLILRRATA